MSDPVWEKRLKTVHPDCVCDYERIAVGGDVTVRVQRIHVQDCPVHPLT